MTPEELKAIANAPGYGSGKRARDDLNRRAMIVRMLPEPGEMNELAVEAEPFVMVAMFGNDAVNGKDWFLNCRGDCLTADCEGAQMDAEHVAAVWNAYRRGILVMAEDE